MRDATVIFFLLSASIACGGCSRLFDGTGELYVPGSGLLGGHAEGYELKSVAFTVTPVGIDLCEHPNGRGKVVVDWDVSGRRIENIAIWVGDGLGRPKRWTYGSSKGSATTGDWVVDNTMFRMTDAANGRTLALRRVYAIRCLTQNS